MTFLRKLTSAIVSPLGVVLLMIIMTIILLGPKSGEGAAGKYFSFIDSTELDSLHVLNRKVQPGETLSNILVSHDVPGRIIHEVVRKSEPVFDLKKIQSGNDYFIINKPHPAPPIQYLIYAHNSVEYVVFKLDDPVTVFKKAKQIEIRKKSVTGRIESSLFDALAGNNLQHELVFRLTELYAYILDFYHLQKGDRFKIIYNEKYAGDRSVALENILAACFNHRDQDYYAFYFKADSAGRYYDENGNSLERRFLKSPLKYTAITSPYSKSRLHPILKQHKPHIGVDYAAPKGTPIRSVGDGIIKKAAYHREFGNYVTIRHNAIYSTQYLHMCKIAEDILPGACVRKGDVIGYVGSTGRATGPHVEFRLWKNGKPIDPLKAEMPKAEPVKNKYYGMFQIRIADLKAFLDKSALPDQALKKSLAKESF